MEVGEARDQQVTGSLPRRRSTRWSTAAGASLESCRYQTGIRAPFLQVGGPLLGHRPREVGRFLYQHVLILCLHKEAINRS